MGQQPGERANTRGPEDGGTEAHSETERLGGSEVMGSEQVTRPDGHTPRNMPHASRWEGWGRENKL